MERTLAILTLCILQGDCVPSARQPRSWEKEACKAGDTERFSCSSEGKITCVEGWIGDLCQVPVCGHDCDPQHGYCVQPGECKCNLGYQGPGCRDCIPLPGCQHGACTKSFTCQCEAGWGGMFCNQPECEDSCAARHGVCVAPGQCECQPGYRGEECAECAPPPGCSHGTCSEPLECACEAGWRGELCDQAVCAETCSAEHGSCSVPGECACQLGWTGPSCDTCMPYPGCVNGACHGEPYTCDCEPGWTGPLCDTPETAVYGAGEREGRCQPLGAFLCFHGGEDVCVYTGAGARVGPPVCRCPPGYWGTWCQDRGNGARVGDTEVAALRPGDLLTVEGVEPRHAHTDTSEEAEEEIQEIERRIHEVHGSLSETMGVRAIHSDVFNSGKLIEHMGAREGLE